LAFEKANDYESDFYISRPEQGVAEVAGAQKCWPGYRKTGTQPGTGKNAGKRVNDCEKIKEDEVDEAAKHGLYYNVNKRKKAGTSRPASSPRAPTDQAWRDAAKTAKNESMSGSEHPDEKEDKALIRKMVKRDALRKEGYGMNGYATAMGSRIQPGNGPDISEDEDDVGQELGMAGSELYGIAKHAKELLALIHQQGQEHGLEAWQQSKITKAADYLTAVLQSLDYDTNVEQGVAEEWSKKYKSSINCSHPKGFSQKAHCAGKKKHTESMMTMEATCPDCGMCQTHGNVMEIKKGAKDSNGVTKCWPGHHAAGTKKGRNGGQVRNCVPNEGVEEDDSYMEALFQKLAEKIPKGASVDYYIKDFAKSTAPQFKNKNPAKRKQMAVAAWNDSKRKK
jgi:hypothetical protein